MLICQWFYAIPVALPFEAQNFSPSMKIGTYKKKTLKIDHQVLKKSLAFRRSRCFFSPLGPRFLYQAFK